MAAYQISNMFQQLKQSWNNGLKAEAMQCADELLSMKLFGKNILFTLLELYIDAKSGNNQISKILKLLNLGISAERNIVNNNLQLNAYQKFLVARAYQKLGKYNIAIELGQSCVDNKAELTSNQLALVYSMLGQLHRQLAMPEQSAEYHLKASNIAEEYNIKLSEYSNYLYTLHFLAKSSDFMRDAAIGYQNIIDNMGVIPYQHNIDQRKKQVKQRGKLRIGYLSSDLKHHVVAEFVQAFFNNYDKGLYEVYCYANCLEDDISQKFSRMVDCWNNVLGKNHAEIAAQIYNDRVDILVELGGHTANNILPVLAYRPAPIQLSGIGYFGSTGLNTVDYIIGDRWLDEQLRDSNYIENNLCLAESHWCYHLETEAGEVQSAPFQKNGYITFGCFNSFNKLNIDVFKCWSKILARIPNSRLLLKGKSYFNEDCQQRLAEMLVEADIDVNRIDLLDYSDSYMKDYSLVDIALDTFPYPGGGTTCDATYMGVPVVTIVGASHHSKFGKSILKNVQLDDCIASTKSEYVDKAVSLATKLQYLEKLHQVLRRRMLQSALMDENRYMAELEGKYQHIWRKFSDGHDTEITARECMIRGFDYYKQNDNDRALWWYRQALAKPKIPNLVELYQVMAESCRDKFYYVQQQKYLKLAWEQLKTEKDKGIWEFQQQLLNSLGSISRKLGKCYESMEYYLQASNIARDIRIKATMYGSYLLSMMSTEIGAQEILQAHTEYNKIFSNVEFSKAKAFSHSDGKIHIGYLSPDFRQHVMFNFYYIMLQGYNRDRFNVTCYSLGKQIDGYTEHLKNIVDQWRDIADMEYDKAAHIIAADGIDILVDLAGHSANGGLPILAWRPAPVQITGLGWVETTGFQHTDYLLTDSFVDPAACNYITERPLYLSSMFCYVGRNDVPVSYGAPCKQKGYILFGVFNSYHKYTDNMLLVWRDIMEQVPNSKLLLKSQIFISLEAQDMVFERLNRLGFDMDRVMFEGATSNYMNRYLDVDIALDTYPYPGGGTTCDALYMGVPVISMYGKRRGSRFGLSILANTGLEELVVDNIQDYKNQAIAMAKDWKLLDALHKNLRNIMQQSNIMNGRKYMLELENRYQEIYAGRIPCRGY